MRRTKQFLVHKEVVCLLTRSKVANYGVSQLRMKKTAVEQINNVARVAVKNYFGTLHKRTYVLGSYNPKEQLI